MSTLSLVIKTNKDPNVYKRSNSPRTNMNFIQTLLAGLDSGALLGSIDVYGASADPVKATATITGVSIVATNTVTIGQTVFTFTASPSSNTATAVDVSSAGADDTAKAAALAAAINANTLGVAPYILATSALGVVTISCKIAGAIGNNISLAKSGAPITLSGSWMTGGAGGPSGTPETIGR